MKQKTYNFKKSSLFLAIATSVSAPVTVFAEEAEVKVEGIERIEVTASRRSSSVQEAPLNITALDGDVMKDQNIVTAEDVARWVPGLSISDQGGREGSSIIVRGLNTNSSERSADGGTVATYLGEIPFNADLRLTDIERVEVLIGPQGTLYGAGTLGGAIRYMLKQPELDITEGEITGDVFSLSESEGTGTEVGLIFNKPLIEDVLAIRASANYFNTPGYVDYTHVVKTPGVSLPDPDWTDQSAIDDNLKRVVDVNDEQMTTARVSLRWQPNDWFDGTLNYFYQKQENGGNSIVQNGTINEGNGISGRIGEYDSAYRVEEPNEKEDDLLSLELKADLGFAELVSASGWSSYDQVGQRDQTDLLYDIWSGYADFPAFVGYTRDTGKEDSFTQEIRLVSQSESPLSWIVGGYYNKLETESDDREYTPGLTEYWGGGIPNIEEDLEYIALSSSEVEESALFGEIAYQVNDKLSVTLGARFYEYEITSRSGSATPLYSGDFEDINQIEFDETHAKDDGNLFKFNTSYQLSDDVLAYFTVSEGFRIGGANGLKECPDELPEQQIVCALPNEIDYIPDTTTNYELGFKSTWLSNRLHFNAALFNVDWEDAQIAAVSVNGQENITSNAGAANSKGVEISTRAMLSDSLIAYATYSYANAELTEDAPYLFGVKDEQGTALQNHYDGNDGDRLPGAPEHQFSLGLSYETEVLDDKSLIINYGLTVQSDVYTKVGLKADGEVLSGYAISNISAKISDDAWSATFYIDNMFNKYAETSVRRDKSWAGMAKFESENKSLPELQRVYGHYITKPLTVGIKFTYLFEL